MFRVLIVEDKMLEPLLLYVPTPPDDVGGSCGRTSLARHCRAPLLNALHSTYNVDGEMQAVPHPSRSILVWITVLKWDTVV